MDLKAVKVQKYFELVCRLCLSPCKDDDEDSHYVASDYKDMTGYLIKSEEEPRKVCQICLKELFNLRAFKLKCLETEQRIKRLKEDGVEEIQFDVGEQEVMLDDDPMTGDNEEMIVEMVDYAAVGATGTDSNVEGGGEWVDQELEFSEGEDLIEEWIDDSPQQSEPDEVETVKAEMAKAMQRVMAKKAPYYCDMCEDIKFPYKTKDYLIRHMKRKHFAVTTDHQCDKCDKDFANKQELYFHKLRDHFRSESKETSYECTVCHRRFSTPQVLESHQNCHLNGGAEQVVVQSKQEIPLTTKTETALEKSSRCTECGREFDSPAFLKHHMRSHMPKDYRCPRCVQQFNLPVGLRNHITRYHPEFKMPPQGVNLKGIDLNTIVYDDYGNVISAEKFTT